MYSFQVLAKYGGIYTDTDVLTVRSFDPLRIYPAVIGKDEGNKFVAGCILSAPKNRFMVKWLDTYTTEFRPTWWVYNSGIKPYRMWAGDPEYRKLLHVENTSLTTPGWSEKGKLFNDIIDWSDLFVIHTYRDNGFSLKNIKTCNSTIGQVLRFICYD